MTPAELKEWRQARGLIQRDAGALLGIAKRTFLYLERGDTRGGKVLATIPRQVELALKGLDAEIMAVFDVSDEAGLRAAYARAIVALEESSSEHRHAALGRLGREYATKKKRA